MESEILRLQGQSVSSISNPQIHVAKHIMADPLRWIDWKEKGQSGGSRLEKC